MSFVLLVWLHLATACTPSAPPPPPIPRSTSTSAPAADLPRGDFASERRLCVELTNGFRATVGAPALDVSPALERYAARAAAHDGRARRAHAYFKRTRGGGVARAENLVPWWPVSRHGSVSAVITAGLEMMWAEGPRGGHRRNMQGPYTEVGCGVFVHGGQVTVVQAFR